MTYLRRFLLGLLGWCSVGLAWGQSNIGFSPFSALGIGELQTIGNSRMAGLGGINVSNADGEHIMLGNPALLPFNRVVNLELTGYNTYRTFSDRNARAQSQGLGPVGVFGAFPMNSHWTMSLGLTPYSQVDYQASFTDRAIGLGDTLIRRSIVTNGGISRVFMGHGYQLFDNFAVGIEGSFLFGNITTENNWRINDRFVNLGMSQDANTVHNGSEFKLGLSYRILPDSVNPIFHSFGLTATYSPGIKGNRQQFFNRRNYQNLLIGLTDTLPERNGTITVPMQLRGGWTFGRLKRWNVGIEGYYSPMSSFTTLDGTSPFTNSYGLTVSGELTNQRKASNYFDIITWRGALSWQQTPYLLNGNPTQQAMLSLGATFPIIRKEVSFAFPNINVAFQVGNVGNLSINNLEERYYRIVLGITLNDKLWFKRFKYE